jgi:ABC-2 type transport system permease protein
VTPEPLRYLLVDLIQDITLWELRATSVKTAPTHNGAYRVTLQLDAQKRKYDAPGQEKSAPRNAVIDVGVFGEDGALLYLRKHRIRSGAQSITITVARKPARAGINPHHKLLEKERRDNIADAHSPGMS